MVMIGGKQITKQFFPLFLLPDIFTLKMSEDIVDIAPVLEDIRHGKDLTLHRGNHPFTLMKVSYSPTLTSLVYLLLSLL